MPGAGLAEGPGSWASPSYLSAPNTAAWPTQEAQHSDEAVARGVGPKVLPTSQGGPPRALPAFCAVV